MNFNHLTIFQRTMFLGVVPSLLIVTLLVGFFIYTRFGDTINRFDEKGTLLAAQLATSSELLLFSGDGSYLDPHADHALVDPEVLCVKVIKEQSLIYKRGDCKQINRPNLHEYSHIIYKPVAFRDIGMQGKKQTMDNLELGRVVVLLSSEQIQREHNQIIIHGLSIGFPAILLALLVSWRIGRSLSEPVVELSKTVHQLTKGDLSARIEVSTKSELGHLQTNVNSLAESLEIHESTRARDLEKVKQAQQEAEAASDAKSQFLAVMSHELRTPMNGVMGMLQLLQTSQLSEEERDYVQTAINSTEHLLTVVNDILDFSRIESGKMNIESVFFRLPELLKSIHQSLEPIAEDKKLPFVLEMGPNLDISVQSDPTRLRQVLINLVGNAIKFTESGFVKISVHHKMLSADTTELTIDIVDTGIGISKQQLVKMFESFNQADSSTSRKYGGTGLGLSISKNLLELMGGQLKVQSQLGVGSTFSCVLSLPYRRSNHTPSHKPLASSVIQVDGEQLGLALLAEDNPVNQKVAVAMLKKIGISVDVAENGFKAVQKCRQKEYDIIFMDIQMPVLDGYQAAEQIRKDSGLNNKTPIVALSANALVEAHDKALSVGMNAYLSKPFKKNELENILKEWLTHN
ncbi:ATP-binding protein [Litoribrevibacter albus]|uniref:Sensory/regulatory protein RpfC n=1 Tax=Litoribrevibacter albus TaxID=1473156 RepID=A0AA37W8Q7_9GAMM|nr:ATP-binding protein [Litoribrevibacter albus]GLQ31841.1 histidine kinase [Litoribrevibacter albus]